MDIVATTADDFPNVWTVIESTIRAGESFALPRDMSEGDARAWWCDPGRLSYAALDGADYVGAHFIKANHLGPGAHVANAGYIVAPHARGRGIARAMCLHSLDAAREAGFRAMQFNMVVSTNETAVRLWRSLGFDVIGALPGAFQHPTRGLVDALVMYKTL
jgi:ribosomal protein S18 acetylase RimI-like enzyme